MPKWHAVWSEGDAPRLLCRLCTPTVCPRCQGGPPCQDVHPARPVRLRDIDAQAPPAMQVIFPENMASAGFARLEAINYPPGALGAGVAGPVSIGHLVAFSKDLEARMQHEDTLGVFCSKGACANVLLLLGAHLVLARGFSAEEALSQLPKTSYQQQRFPAPWAREPMWHAHSLTVKDCLVGLQIAVKSGWLDYEGFNSDEWHRLLRTYDASFTFHLPLKAPTGEPRRLTFYAMADPVTTVADPGVRPAPPEDGFVSDYVKLNRGTRQRIRTWNSDERRRGRKSPDQYSSEPPGQTRFERMESAPEPTQGGAAESGESLPKSQGDPPQEIQEKRWSTYSGGSGDRGASDSKEDGHDEDTPVDVPEKPVMPASMPLGSLFRQREGGGARDWDGGDAVGWSSGRDQPLPSSTALDEARARTDSKTQTSDPTKLGKVTWLETVRVRRWGQEQHSRQSSMPVRLVKEHGLTTLPEFGTWLRSVGCRRLVQLNRPNEVALPSSGSYSDYFAQWQLRQEALHFDDGSVPPAQVVRSLRSVVEEVIADMDQDSPSKTGSGSAIVVHCAAGLGRTGTLLGVLAMDMARIPGGAWMGWVRMCRPGSVQTLAQEKFLKTYQPQEPAAARRAGALHRLLRGIRCARGGEG